MSASNFHNENASKIYAIQCDDSGNDGYFYDDTRENVQSDIFALPHSIDARKTYNDLRSYPVSPLATLYETFTVGEYESTLYCTAIMRAGYYDGANLDYEFEEDFDYNLEGEALAKTEKWLIEAKVRLGEKLEAIFKKYSTPLVVFAHFSNGEAWYAKA